MKIAIIGAGIAGLTAAHQLHPYGHVTLFEKSRTFGGRAATRWHDLPSGARIFVDHGAQYMKDESPALHQLITQAFVTEDLVEIARPVWTFDRSGNIQEGDPAQNRGPKLSYRRGLATLGRLIAQTAALDVRLQTRIGKLTQGKEGFVLFEADGSLLGQFDYVLCTIPAPQAADLIEASELPKAPASEIVSALKRAVYRRCLSITLGFERVVNSRPYYALINADRQHPIAWLAFEHEKPGHVPPGNGILIAQMGPTYSVEQWDTEREQVIAEVMGEVTKLLGNDWSNPTWTEYQKWHYALPDQIVPASALNGHLVGLGFAGDYMQGGRIHLAAQSGYDTAHELIAKMRT